MYIETLKTSEKQKNMRGLRTPFCVGILLLCGSTIGSASPIFDGWALNIDGVFITFADFASATGPALSAVGGLPPGVSIQTGAMNFGTIDVAGGGGQIGGGTGFGTMSV